MEHFLLDFLKAIWIGGTLTVPGVSGGTMAMVLGVYGRLISAVNEVQKGINLRKNIIFLGVFCLGGLLGAVVVSQVVSYLLEYYSVRTVLFFTGLIAGGVPVLFKEIRGGKRNWKDFLFFAIGFIGVFLISLIPNGTFSVKAGGNLFVQFICGTIAAVALVLPGISVSHMLYVFGIYESLTDAVSKFDLIVLVPFGVGVTVGIVLTARAVSYLLVSFKRATYSMILGFVGGSVVELLCSVGIRSVDPIAVLLLIAGYFAMNWFVKYKKVGT